MAKKIVSGLLAPYATNQGSNLFEKLLGKAEDWFSGLPWLTYEYFDRQTGQPAYSVPEHDTRWLTSSYLNIAPSLQKFPVENHNLRRQVKDAESRKWLDKLVRPWWDLLARELERQGEKTALSVLGKAFEELEVMAVINDQVAWKGYQHKGDVMPDVALAAIGEPQNPLEMSYIKFIDGVGEFHHYLDPEYDSPIWISNSQMAKLLGIPESSRDLSCVKLPGEKNSEEAIVNLLTYEDIAEKIGGDRTGRWVRDNGNLGTPDVPGGKGRGRQNLYRSDRPDVIKLFEDNPKA